MVPWRTGVILTYQYLISRNPTYQYIIADAVGGRTSQVTRQNVGGEREVYHTWYYSRAAFPLRRYHTSSTGQLVRKRAISEAGEIGRIVRNSGVVLLKLVRNASILKY